MSSPSPETETYEVTLSREEQWVVHHVLATHIDEAVDADEDAPTWALEAFDALESDDDPETFTGRQANELLARLETYLGREKTPQRDVVHGSSALDRLEAAVESPA